MAETLSGGNMNVVVRIGDTVRRPTGPWTPAVHAVLDRLAERGVDWAPRAHGRDAEGREVLDFLPGEALAYPMPAWVWADPFLLDATARMRELHDATAGLDIPGASWLLPAHEPREVICHNDFAPYNFVVAADHSIAGVIDWDTMSPGPRIWDLAYLAYRVCPLTTAGGPETPPDAVVREQARRLGMLLDAYDGSIAAADLVDTAAERLDDLAAFTLARAEETGRADLRSHVDLYRTDAAYLRRSSADLASAPR